MDAVFVCFGINDIFHARNADMLWFDLSRIAKILRNSGCAVIMITIPPFEMAGSDLDTWLEVNRRIRANVPDIDSVLSGTDKSDLPPLVLFDIAKYLGQPSPNEHLPAYGPHPDGIGGAAATDAFISEFGTRFTELLKK